MRVRVPPRPPANQRDLAYIIGIALGDGNLSNPNGRAIRLRITCDTKYPKLEKEIIRTLKRIFPKNKVSRIFREKTHRDISVYSNRLALYMPWKVGKGSKISQQARVPRWIKTNIPYTRECLRGLLQTDGSIYRDRGYLMVNFTNHARMLVVDVYNMISMLGYKPTFHTARYKKRNLKYTVRVARDSKKFTKEIALQKK